MMDAHNQGKPLLDIMSNQKSSHYDPLNRAFHWLTAIAVAIAFVLGPGGFGRLMRQGVDPATRSSIVWHETLGLLVLALTLLRPAAPQFEMASWMTTLAKLMHLALWTLMLVLPATALLALGSEGHPLTLLGGVRLDEMPLIANSSIAGLADWGDVHGFLGDALMALAGLHAAAAVYHHVVMRDGVMLAMLPERK
jgi:cytochrome b561